VLNQDYGTASRSGMGGLISSLERWRGGNLIIDGQDFEGGVGPGDGCGAGGCGGVLAGGVQT
jgi:hypothetical protein